MISMIFPSQELECDKSIQTFPPHILWRIPGEDKKWLSNVGQMLAKLEKEKKELTESAFVEVWFNSWI